MGCHALLQGIFQTQRSNPGLPHCRRILYHLGHQGNPRILVWVTYPFSRGSSWPRIRTGVSCIAGGFFTNWATREARLLLYSITNFFLVMKTVKIYSLSSFQICNIVLLANSMQLQYRHHAVYYIPRAYLFYNYTYFTNSPLCAFSNHPFSVSRN